MAPIWFISIMILAFAYLGYETNWMTVRLLVGSELAPLQILKLRNQYNIKPTITPICGWYWLAFHEHPTIDYMVELIIGTTRQRIVTNQPQILAKVLREYRKPHKPTMEVYPPSHYPWGLAGALTA